MKSLTQLVWLVLAVAWAGTVAPGQDFPPGFTAVGEWGAGIPGADPEMPTRLNSKDGAFCIYKPALEKPVQVRVSLFRVSEAGSRSTQRYEVHHRGSVTPVDVEFAGVTGWVTLGTFAFAGSGNEYVRLNKGRTAEMKFTLLSDDGKNAVRSIVIPAGKAAYLPPPPAHITPRAQVAVVLPARPPPAPWPPVTHLQLPPHISDGMVLQRGQNILITGRAPEQATVLVTLNGVTASARTVSGAFSVVLPAMPAGGPYALTIRCGNDERVIKNVMLGEVWIVAGQSNMAFAAGGLDDARQVLADADYPDIRYYKQGGGAGPTPGSPARWVACTPRQAGGFTAVGFLFARRLHKELKVPVGLMYAWRDGGDIRLFMRDEALAALTPLLPFKPGSKPRSTLFSAFLAPLVGYPVAGLFYYQGEGNQKEPLFYRDLLPAMVKDVRALWGQGDFPFIYVQLPRYKDGFVGVREAQFLAQQRITNSAMVVSLDTGNPNLLHPGDKGLIGERAAQAALGLAYKKPGEYTGPMFAGFTTNGGSLVVRFTHAGTGLAARGALDGFALCDESGAFAPAQAEITGPDAVRVWRADVARPVAVRYLWSGAPRPCLYNREGFPASPFRTDPMAVNRSFDNRDPNFVTCGAWNAATPAGSFAGDCLVAADTRAADGECDWPPWAKWTLEVQRAGLYGLYVHWPEKLATTAAVSVAVNAGGCGYPPVSMAPTAGGGWRKVGSYRLDYGNSDTLKLIATGPGAVADAVKMVLETAEEDHP